MAEYTIRMWRAGRLYQAREAVEEGYASYAEIVADINAGKYEISPEEVEA